MGGRQTGPGEDLRALHGAQYVPMFERDHRDARLARLMPLYTLRQTDAVLDIGCGSGFLAPYVAPLVGSYLGIDFSEPFIPRARQLHGHLTNVAFRHVDLATLASESARFDVLFALDVSEHVPDAAWLTMLRDARRVITSGGRFYLHTPNAGYFLERMKARNLLIPQIERHVAVRNGLENARLFEEAGFHVERVVMLPHYNVLRWLDPLRHLPLIGPWFESRVFIEARS